MTVRYGAVDTYLGSSELKALRSADRPNAHLVWKRLWCGAIKAGRFVDDPQRQVEHLREVAAAAGSVSADWLRSLAGRRLRAAEMLARRSPEPLVARQLTITPHWRVVVGHGEESIHETGLTFSPTHGVPMWPGSTLKGLAAARCRVRFPAIAAIDLFGAPRPVVQDDRTVVEGEPRQGSVMISDALPWEPPNVVVDVLTPHVVPYYNEVNSSDPVIRSVPGEYHEPNPVRFLAVEKTPFHVTLLGERKKVNAVTLLLREALDENGIGGKTNAGYGYCAVTG